VLAAAMLLLLSEAVILSCRHQMLAHYRTDDVMIAHLLDTYHTTILQLLSYVLFQQTSA
jgi:hypothetical protein